MGYFSQNYADFSQNYANYVAFYLRVDHILLPISSFLVKIWFLSVYNTNVVHPWLKVASFIAPLLFLLGGHYWSAVLAKLPSLILRWRR